MPQDNFISVMANYANMPYKSGYIGAQPYNNVALLAQSGPLIAQNFSAFGTSMMLGAGGQTITQMFQPGGIFGPKYVNFNSIDNMISTVLGGTGYTLSLANVSFPNYGGGFGQFPNNTYIEPFHFTFPGAVNFSTSIAGSNNIVQTNTDSEITTFSAITYYDSIYGTYGDDYIDATVYNYWWGIYGGWSVYADSGDDLILGGPGYNLIDGGDGFDMVWYGAAASVSVDLNDATAQGAGREDTLYNIEGVFGSSGNDYIAGDSGLNILIGAAGADTLVGYGDLDILAGGTGVDVYTGGSGADIFGYGTYAWEMAGDTITDFSIQDMMLIPGVLLGQNQLALAGASGGSVLWLDTNGDGIGDVNINLAGIPVGRSLVAVASSDAAFPATAIVLAPAATSGDDVLLGMGAAESIDGLAGNDFIVGYNGNDTLRGSGGDDILVGGFGNNSLDGGSGRDFLIGDIGIDRYTLGGDQDIVAGLPAHLTGDTVTDFTSEDAILVVGSRFGPDQLVVETVAGGIRLWCDTNLDGIAETSITFQGLSGSLVAIPTAAGEDAATFIIRAPSASAGNDILIGLAASETLSGLAGDDMLLGFSGNDTLSGGDGNDELVGGPGNDQLSGGAGSDFFIGAAATLNGDTITDLTADDAIVIVGNRFDAGDVSLTSSAGGRVLRIDADGNGSLETQINLPGLAAGGFIVKPSDASLDALTVLVFSPDPTSGDDTLWGSAGNDTISALAGNDVVTAGAGNNSVVGGSGNDILIGDAGQDTLSGGPGDDILVGRSGADRYRGAAGVDVVIGSLVDLNGDTIIDFTADDGIAVDTIRLDADALSWTTISGGTLLHLDGNGDGVDDAAITLLGTFNGTFAVSASAATDPAYTLITFEPSSAVATTGNDILDGTGGNDSIDALAGNDSVSGDDGDDSLTGGRGADTLVGGNGTDTLDGGAGADSMAGGDGGDRYLVDNLGDVIVEQSGQGADEVFSAISYTLPVEVDDLTLTGAVPLDGTGNALGNVITGNDAANVIRGLAGDDAIDGLAGNDSLAGGTGNDTLDAGSGNDTLDGGTGADAMTGGAGDDFYRVDDTGDQVTELSGEGTDTVASSVTRGLAANQENLTLTGDAAIDGTGNSLANSMTGNSAANSIAGLAGNDSITGGGGNDTLSGDAGNDTLGGGNNDDMLLGGSGNDQLAGDAGLDTLAGGAGADTLTGGAGGDRFEFSGANGTDTISDFQNGIDHIRIIGYGIALDGFDDLTIVDLGNDARVNLHDGVTGAGFIMLTGIADIAAIDASDFIWI